MTTTLESVLEELKAMRRSVEEMISRGGERPRLYEYKEAARLIGVHPKTVSVMVRTGQLMTVTVKTGRGPGKRMIPIEEIDRICRVPRMESSGATPERVRFDGAAALRKLDELTKKRR